MNQANLQNNTHNTLGDYVGAFIRQYLENTPKNSKGTVPNGNIYQLVLNAIEPEILEKVLHHVGGNQTEAAQLLGISRSTLRKKLTKYQM